MRAASGFRTTVGPIPASANHILHLPDLRDLGVDRFLVLRVVEPRSPEKAEAQSTSLSNRRVVHAVGVDDSLQVAAFRLKLEPLDSAVKHDIVEQNVADTVQRDSEAGGSNLVQFESQPRVDENKREPGKKEEVQVVLLEDATLPVMVIVMQTPAGSVHDVFVHESRDKLHADCRTGKSDDTQYDANQC